MVVTNKGFCQKHGREFILTEGCPLCLAEKRGEKIDLPEQPDSAELVPQARGDVEVINYYSQAVKLKEYAEGRMIKTPEDLKVASDDMTLIARLKKALEGKREESLRPHLDKAKEIREDFKFLMEPIETADRVTREKIRAFNEEQERQRREQEEVNRLRMEAAEKEAALKDGEITEPVNLVEVIEPAKRVSTEMGTVSTMKIRKYRVVNFAELPDQYKIENSALLNKVVKAGIPSIPGVEIYIEETVRVSGPNAKNR